MLVLHAAIDRDQLLVWGETDVAAELSAPDTTPGHHPWAASSAAVEAAVQHLVEAATGSDDLVVGRPVDAVAWLPSRGKAPLPSSPLVAPAGRAARGAVAGRPWRVQALQLTGSGALRVLRACDAAEPSVAIGLATAPSLRAVTQLARIAGGLVVRQQYLPGLVPADGDLPPQARWHAYWDAGSRAAYAALVADLPAAAGCVRVEPAAGMDAAPSGPPSRLDAASVDAFVDRLVDTLVRQALVARPTGTRHVRRRSPHDNWLEALASPDPSVELADREDIALRDAIAHWQRPLLQAARAPFRLCLRLEEPEDVGERDEEIETPHGRSITVGPVWHLRYLLQARDDPSVIVPAAHAWKPTGATREVLARRRFSPGEHLLAPLGEAARWSEAVADGLRTPHPTGVELDTAGAHRFLAESAPELEAAGFGVLVPSWWRGRQARSKVNLRARVRTGQAGTQARAALDLRALVEYDWQLAIGDASLSRRELDQLAAQKVPLVQVRGEWVELGAGEIEAALAAIERIERRRARPLPPSPTEDLADEGALTATIGELLQMSVGAGELAGLPVGGVEAPGGIADLLATLGRGESPVLLDPPQGLRATLRPYQQRGYSWLTTMVQLGLGACLADDMGLGKSVQTLAAIQHEWEAAGSDAGGRDGASSRRPSLVVCPTSVLGNWLHECERFTPDLPVLLHYGSDRAVGDRLPDRVADSAIVFTSYALLVRDAAALASVDWHLAVLDEAQNIKNPHTRQAVAARDLRARGRVALTGTPVENGVADLWSLMQYLNPGLLGGPTDFRRKYVIPIQTGTFPEAGDRLRRITAPFILRRLKTDPTVISDLPEKLESKVWCSLTHEQASLYEAVVRDTEDLLHGKRPQGVERRGAILAALSKLKQVCNHPAQFLADGSPVADRSGKLQRAAELLDQVVHAGGRALVFTQFAAMGAILQRHLQEQLGREVLFLHGGTSRARREVLVQRFQDGVGSVDAPPVLVLSLKAGGSGLNLTAANHVVHYDRWWNPAVEQQATDRAFRIGQHRTVQVHTLVCAGTIEEKIDTMIQHKRSIADRVVGDGGESWITELDDDDVLELLQLRAATMLQPARLDDTDNPWTRKPLLPQT